MELNDIYIVLGRIEAEVKNVQSLLSDHRTATDRALSDHEARLKVLEKAHAKALGVIGLVSMLGSGLGIFLWRVFTKTVGQ